MRAPGEATGSIALESAIDEMAQACGMDPLAFRLKNYAEVEPISGKPFSSKELRECYRQGAARFGWDSRPLAPRQMQDDHGLFVGWGMGHGDVSGPHVPGPGESGAASGRQRRHGDWGA
jgi:xanthine dehydrogenase YagR molybdenum-binding subunit